MATLPQKLSNMFLEEKQIDQAAEPLQKAVSKIFQNSGPLGQKIANLLNGSWLGHPVHPVLTDIPIGAWMVAVTLDGMEAGTGSRGIGKAADAAVALGVAGAVGSAVSGLADWQHTVGESRRTGFTHALLNTTALVLFIGSLAARGKRQRGLGRALALTGFSIAGVAAYLGGDLVYRQKIGVNHAPEGENLETKGFVPVLALENLPENTPTIALLNNIPLVLVRRGQHVYALAETCAHLGGPLADGKLEQGADGQPVIVCPWHSSRFDMRDGAVLDGPSAYPQPCFKTRIRDGQVEVRHAHADE